MIVIPFPVISAGPGRRSSWKLLGWKGCIQNHSLVFLGGSWPSVAGCHVHGQLAENLETDVMFTGTAIGQMNEGVW